MCLNQCNFTDSFSESSQQSLVPYCTFYNYIFKKIYLGFGWWLAKNVFDMIFTNSTNEGKFVRNISIVMFGLNTLKTSTVSGRLSNNRQNKELTEKPKKLDQSKIHAIEGMCQVNNDLLTSYNLFLNEILPRAFKFSNLKLMMTAIAVSFFELI